MEIAVELHNFKNIEQTVGTLPHDLVGEIDQSSGNIPLDTLIKLARWKCYKTEKTGLNKLLQNAVLLLPGVQSRTENPELEKRKIELQKKQNQVAYNEMVSNITKPSRTNARYQASLTSGFNFVLTLFASVFAATYVLSSFVPNLALRVGIGFVIGTVLVAIEVFLAVREVQKQEALQKL